MGIVLKDRHEIARMKAAGRVVAAVLDAVEAACVPGVTTAELDRIAADDKLSRIVDVPRLRAALEDWPEHTETDPQKYFAREFAVPRGLLTARFINYVDRRNQP